MSDPAARPSSALSRRGFLAAGAAGAALAGLGPLTACGNATDGGSTGSRSGSTADSAAGGDFPVTVTGRLGPVTVPTAPRRVVACGYLRDTDIAVALGLPLVGVVGNAAFHGGLAPWQNVPRDVPVLTAGDALPFEKIAALRPDLILAADDYGLDKNFATLQRIAPTLGYRDGIGRDSWQTTTARVGHATGRTDRANDLVTATTKAVQDARDAHPQFRGKTFTFGPVTGTGEVDTVSRTTDATVPFFQQLGLTLSPTVTRLPASGTPGRSTISLEQLPAIDADVLVLTFTDDATRRDLEGRSVFRRLAAVRRGSYVPLDLADAVSMAFPSVLSIPYGLRIVVPKLAAAASAAA